MKAATYFMIILGALPLVLVAAIFQPLTLMAQATFSTWSEFSTAQRGPAIGCMAILLYPIVFGGCVFLADSRRKRLSYQHAFWISCIPTGYVGTIVAFFAMWQAIYPA
jgi:hypothetical protein